MPPSAIHSWMRARSSSSKPKRRRTGSRSARSSTCEAVIRAPVRSSSCATTPSTGLVWRSARSARRTRRSGTPVSAGASSGSSSSASSAPTPNVAWISGANASMSGHMTMTSRGSRLGSSCSMCRIASRATSTCRARPWQACTCTLRSPGSSSGRRSSMPGSGAPSAARSARTSAWIRASSVSPRCSTRVVMVVRPRRPCRRRAAARVRPAPTRPAGCWPAASRSRRRRGARCSAAARAPRRPAPTAPARGAAGTDARRDAQRARAAPRPAPQVGASGRTATAAPADRRARARRVRRAHAFSRRSAGPGMAMARRRRRHSCACHSASSGRARPRPSVSCERAQARTISGRCSP